MKIFLGPKQYAKHASLNAAQKLGSNCEYIHVLKPGRNALDFHIAYYLGILSRTHADFYIIAEDAGYDALLEQLRAGNVTALRVASISKIPPLACKALTPPKLVKPHKSSIAASSFNELVEKSILDLRGLGDNGPSTLKKLHNRLRTHLNTDPQTAAKVAQELQKRGVAVADEKGGITYRFSDDISAAA